MEKNYEEDMTRAGSIKLAVKSLLEVVQTGAKNIEIAVMEVDGVLDQLKPEQIEAVVAEIEADKAAEEEEKVCACACWCIFFTRLYIM